MTDTDAPTPKQRFPLPKDWTFDAAIASNLLNRHGHGGFLGLEYRSHGADWVELALPWREDLVGVPATGVLASGPIISLLDNVTSLSMWARREVFSPQATLDLRIDYVRAATPGKTLIARGECYRLKRSIGFVRGIAHEGDPQDPVAHAAGTFMLTES